MPSGVSSQRSYRRPTFDNLPSENKQTYLKCMRSLERNDKAREQAIKALSQVGTVPHTVFFVEGVVSGVVIADRVAKVAGFANNYYDSKHGKQINNPKAPALLEGKSVVSDPDNLSEVPIGSGNQASKLGESISASSHPFAREIGRDLSTPEAAGLIGEALDKGGSFISAFAKNYQPPSVDEMKSGIKNALMAARQDAKLNGAYEDNKVGLNEISTWSRLKILDADGTVAHGSKQRKACDLAMQNLEAFIKLIAPHIDAKMTMEASFIDGGGTAESSIIVKRMAVAALKDIQEQGLGRRYSLDRHGNIMYPFPNAFSSHFPRSLNSSDRDMGSEEPNPYSPLGPPGANRDYSYRSSEEFAMCGGFPNRGMEHSDRDGNERGSCALYEHNDYSHPDPSNKGNSWMDIAEHLGNGDFGSAARETIENSTFREVVQAVFEAQARENEKEQP